MREFPRNVYKASDVLLSVANEADYAAALAAGWFATVPEAEAGKYAPPRLPGEKYAPLPLTETGPRVPEAPVGGRPAAALPPPVAGGHTPVPPHADKYAPGEHDAHGKRPIPPDVVATLADLKTKAKGGDTKALHAYADTAGIKVPAKADAAALYEIIEKALTT